MSNLKMENEKILLQVGDLILFKNDLDVRFIYEVVGIYLGALHQDSVAELRPIDFEISTKGNQLVNPLFIEKAIEIGLFKLIDRKSLSVRKNEISNI